MLDLSDYEDRFSTISAGQAMKISWRKMSQNLFRKFSFKHLTFFSFLGLFSRLEGGSIHFDDLGGLFWVYVPIIYAANSLSRIALSKRAHNQDVYRTILFSNFAFCISLIFIIGIIWDYIQARLKIVYLSSIGTGQVNFLRQFKEYKAVGRSFFRWELFFFLIFFMHIASAAFFSQLSEGTGLGSFWSALAPFAFIGSLITLGILNFFVNRTIMPLMCIKKIRFSDAWRLFKKLYGVNKDSFLSYLFGSLGMLVAFVLCSFIFGVLIFTLLPSLMSFYDIYLDYTIYEVPVALILLYLFAKIVSAFLLQPLQMWYQGWALAFFSGFGDDFKIERGLAGE